ncbi:MAG TPA: hypothetical protein VNL77_01075 [Roseiflexaceae bacterium]|nr:hypothetical protein [Roseiflexaceae bacterium]
MSWFVRIAALIAVLMLLGIGVYLIAADHIYSGLGLLALSVPLQWMGAIPELKPPQLDDIAYDQHVEPPPLSVLIAFGLAGICFVLAIR